MSNKSACKKPLLLSERDSQASLDYTAKNIKIVEDDNFFDFRLVENLAHKYCRPVNFIRRSIEACRLSGVDPREYFVKRYLDGDKSIPENHDVTEISRELQRNIL